MDFKVLSIAPSLKYLIARNDSFYKLYDISDLNNIKDILIPFSSDINCFKWNNNSYGLRNKRKKVTQSQVDIVFGMKAGNVYFYNINHNEIPFKLNGHTSQVNDCIWANEDLFISCAENIIFWNLSQLDVINKWELAEKVYCMDYDDSTNFLITAGCKITIWDIDKHTIHAHIDNINFIKMLDKSFDFHENYHAFKKKHKANGDSILNGKINGHMDLNNTNHVNSNYLISSNFENMEIKFWSLDLDKIETPLVSISTMVPINSLNIFTNNPILTSYIATVLANGIINIFLVPLNSGSSPTRKPQNPIHTISFRRKIFKGSKGIDRGNHITESTIDEVSDLSTADIILPILSAKFISPPHTPQSPLTSPLPLTNGTDVHDSKAMCPKLIICYSNLVHLPSPSSQFSSPDKNTSSSRPRRGGLKPHTTKQKTNEENSCNFQVSKNHPFIVETIDLADMLESDIVFYRNINEHLKDPTVLEQCDSKINGIVTRNNPLAAQTLTSRIRKILIEKQKTPSMFKQPSSSDSSYLPSIINIAPPSQTPQPTNNDHQTKSNELLLPMSLTVVPPKANTLSITIIQALQAGDSTKLWNVLIHKDDPSMIRETLFKVPLTWIIPFIYQIANKMTYTRTKELNTLLKWFNSVLLHFSTHIISNPELYRTLFAIQELLNDRTMYLNKMLRLKGLIRYTKFSIEGNQKQVQSNETSFPVDLHSRNAIYFAESESDLDEDNQIDL